jgi:hypothetical protein
VSLSRSLPGNSRNNANAFVRPRYARRNSMSQHRRAVTDDENFGATPLGAAAMIAMPARTCPDQSGCIFGRYKAAAAARPSGPASALLVGSGGQTTGLAWMNGLCDGECLVVMALTSRPADAVGVG